MPASQPIFRIVCAPAIRKAPGTRPVTDAAAANDRKVRLLRKHVDRSVMCQSSRRQFSAWQTTAAPVFSVAITSPNSKAQNTAGALIDFRDLLALRGPASWGRGLGKVRLILELLKVRYRATVKDP